MTDELTEYPHRFSFGICMNIDLGCICIFYCTICTLLKVANDKLCRSFCTFIVIILRPRLRSEFYYWGLYCWSECIQTIDTLMNSFSTGRCHHSASMRFWLASSLSSTHFIHWICGECDSELLNAKTNINREFRTNEASKSIVAFALTFINVRVNCRGISGHLFHFLYDFCHNITDPLFKTEFILLLLRLVMFKMQSSLQIMASRSLTIFTRTLHL